MNYFDKYTENKQRHRKDDVALIRSGKVSALELGKSNFCMKGANLKDARVSRTEFRLFV